MSRPKRSERPVTAAEALQILFSAVGYVRQAGLKVQAGNVGGRLVLAIGGAQVSAAGGFTVTSAPDAVTGKVTAQAPAADVTERPKGMTP